MFDIIFSVIQWTRLESLRGRFWALGRMFDAPALDHQQKNDRFTYLCNAIIIDAITFC